MIILPTLSESTKFVVLLKTRNHIKMRGPGKGKTNNPKGRTKGAGNIVGRDRKVWIAAFLDNHESDFETTYSKLDDKDKVRAYLDLMSFIIPKQQAVSFENKVAELTSMFPTRSELDQTKTDNQ